MEHVKALAIKGVMTLAVLWIVLGAVYDMAFWPVILVTTIVLGAVSYFAGDLGILPAAGDVMATVSDLVLTFFIVLVFALMLTDAQLATVALGAFVSALIIGAGEYLFHVYMLKFGPVAHMRKGSKT